MPEEIINTEPGAPRDFGSYTKSSRSVVLSTQDAHKQTISPRKYNRFEKFLPTNLKWIVDTLKNFFNKKVPFKTYDGTNDTGIYKLPQSSKPTVISIVSDWASYTEECAKLTQKIAEKKPEFTINLGDTYFIGEEQEINANFNPKDSPWYYGEVGSFSTTGNHDMYSNGYAFFANLLPWMGIHKPNRIEQKASFFCLENDFWRIICFDTGYNSVGGFNNLPFINTTSIPEPCIEWMKNTLKIGDDQRGIVFLSHHQYMSAFDDSYSRPPKQLAELIGTNRKVIWLWGHEHRMAIYGKYAIKNGITVYGRCVGHGGMPVELLEDKKLNSNKKIQELNLVLVDNRQNPALQYPKPIGYNGYCNVNIKNENISIDYCDDQANVLVTEQWRYNPQSKSIEGVTIKAQVEKLNIIGPIFNAIKP